MAAGNRYDYPGQVFKNNGTSRRSGWTDIYGCWVGADAFEQADVD